MAIICTKNVTIKVLTSSLVGTCSIAPNSVPVNFSGGPYPAGKYLINLHTGMFYNFSPTGGFTDWLKSGIGGTSPHRAGSAVMFPALQDCTFGAGAWILPATMAMNPMEVFDHPALAEIAMVCDWAKNCYNDDVTAGGTVEYDLYQLT